MIVTDIIPINNKKSRIYLDEQFAFVLYKGELRSYHIKKGEQLSRNDYDTILGEVLPKRATKRVNLLMEKSYTRHQLIEKLQSGDYPQNCIDAAISYVERYGYVDDLQYALDFISYRAERCNRRQIITKLAQKGIDPDVIEQALESFSQEGHEIEEKQQIEAFLTRKNYFTMEDESLRQKAVASLMRKGYRYEMIRDVIREMQ